METRHFTSFLNWFVKTFSACRLDDHSFHLGHLRRLLSSMPVPDSILDLQLHLNWWPGCPSRDGCGGSPSSAFNDEPNRVTAVGLNERNGGRWKSNSIRDESVLLHVHVWHPHSSGSTLVSIKKITSDWNETADFSTEYANVLKMFQVHVWR